MRHRNNLLGFAVLTLAVAMGVVGVGAVVEAQPSGASAVQKTGGKVVGAAVSHPSRWTVEREPYTFDDTYGYTLWRPDTEKADEHGGKPALRVALAYDLDPGEIEAEVRDTIDEYPDLSLERETVAVGREHEGVAVGPIPGSTPFTQVYVPVNGRVYSIDVYYEGTGDEGLGEEDERLLSGIRFEPPSRSVRSLDAPAANSPEELYPSGAEAREIEQQDDGKGSAGVVAGPVEEPSTTATRTTSKAGGETRIAEGCWRAPPRFYVQTQQGLGANAAADDDTTRGVDRIPTGWTRIGVHNFWGQYTHGNIGYGRCNEPYYTNDKYAVDYPLNRYDYVYSPFACGTVTHVGRQRSHADYGVFVAIRACNGRYANISAHLQSVRSGLREGDTVRRGSVLGYAGDTGGGNISVGRVHLHTAFYRYPKYQGGAPYGGQSLQVNRVRYLGNAARRAGISVRSQAYTYAIVRPNYSVYCREGYACGEGYKVSN